MPKLIKGFCREFGDGEVVYKAWLLKRCDDDTARAIADPEYAGNPGGWFTNTPSIRHSKSYTLVVQRMGWDV